MRVLIIQNEENLRQNYALCLNADAGIEVVAAFGGGEEALAQLERSKPDVLLIDLCPPATARLDVISKAKARVPEIEILVQVRFSDLNNVIDAIKAGATGFIVAWAPHNELVEALHNLQKGIVTIDPQLARAIIGEFQNGSEDKKYGLSGKEETMLKRAASGCTLKEIAGDLKIDIIAVYYHIKAVYEKLQQKYQRGFSW